MAYRFKLGQDLEKGLRRIGVEQLDRAVEQLSGGNAGAAVHETRKGIKRVRALLRLVRDGIGNAAFQRENQRLGDIGRMLSTSRDLAVIRATIDRLVSEHPDAAPALRALKKSVAVPSGEKDAAWQRLATRARRELVRASKAFGALELKQQGMQPIEQALSRGLADIRAAMLASDAGDDEAVHEWRKAIQRHWRHMLLMRAGWEAYFVARANEAKEISELLGHAQDLTLLIGHAEAVAGAEITIEQAETVVGVAARRREMLRAAARERCVRLTAEGPDGHAKRVAAYWRAAREIETLEAPLAPSPASQDETVLAAADDGVARPGVKISRRIRADAPGRRRVAAARDRKRPARRKKR